MEKQIQNFKNGWDPNDPTDTRRAMILKLHGGNELEAITALQLITNTSKDRYTRIMAAEDAVYLFKQHQGRNTFKNRMLKTVW
jgi:hypothetical protein